MFARQSAGTFGAEISSGAHFAVFGGAGVVAPYAHEPALTARRVSHGDARSIERLTRMGWVLAPPGSFFVDRHGGDDERDADQLGSRQDLREQARR